MHEFKGGCGGQCLLPIATTGFTGKKAEHGAHALAGSRLAGVERRVGPAHVVAQHAEESGVARVGGLDDGAHFRLERR